MFFCNTLIGNNYNKVKSGIIYGQPLDYWFTDAIFYNNRFWGLHTSFSGDRLLASSDGITYSPQYIGTISGRYGCLCPDRTDGRVMCTFVTDETNGRVVCSNGNITRYINDDVHVEQCIFVNGQYYLVGGRSFLGGGRIYIGSDLSNWQDPIQLSTNYITGIAYGNGIFVVCANVNDHQVFVSYDGLNYKNYATPIGCVKVIFADGYFVGVGYGGVIRSRNGIDWEQIYTEKNVSLTAVGYGNKKLVVAGDKILTSINFKDFKRVATNINNYKNTITYGNNRFVVTDEDTLYYFDWGIE